MQPLRSLLCGTHQLPDELQLFWGGLARLSGISCPLQVKPFRLAFREAAETSIYKDSKSQEMHFMRNARASSFSLGAPGQETPWAEWATTPRTIDTSEHPFFAPREWSWRRRLCTGRQEAPLPRWRTHARCVFFDGSTSRLVAFAAAATNGHCGKLFA